MKKIALLFIAVLITGFSYGQKREKIKGSKNVTIEKKEIGNFENLEKGLAEIYRVLKPNGIFVILETSVPTKFPFKQGYAFYTKFILPIIGKVFSKDNDAYGYLSESAANFPFGETLNNILRKISFIECKAMPQTMGVATIYTATKK